MKTIKREIKTVPARKVHFSKILPHRHSYDTEILESMKVDGVQQPLIVRPLPKNPEEYEIIDGNMRRLAFKDDDLILVDVRYDLSDSEVFKLSEMTFKRKQRTTHERAASYFGWVQAEHREYGKRGAQARVAKKARMTEGEISQYLAIHKMFAELEQLPGSAAINFNALNNQGINKLYELSKLTKYHKALLHSVQQLAEQPNMSIRELGHIVKEEIEQALEEFPPVDLEDEEKDSNEMDNKITLVRKLTGEMLKTVDEITAKLKFFEARMEDVPEKYLKSEILKELQKLRRRFKRLQKDIARLPHRGWPKGRDFTPSNRKKASLERVD